uniref:cilium assembly protein DZIP1 isoform X4 n=1 Tax=Monopterus albus TaxID=43700 RepID=UPI0009B31C37|nr:zinc finger protein Dzip1-like isoform X4 [Monopterus albus]
MPFHDNVFYRYTSDTQGTHSSAGIPSLLNSPLSQHSVNSLSVPVPGMTPSSGATTFIPFKFRPRRESVDWRRINAVDIDLVVSQLDVDALQEHISTVTFCSLDGERCQRCQSPVDPALVKLLRLAQLTVEWLLHCQEFLTLNLCAVEERLTASSREREQLLAQQKKQEEKVKMLTSELKQRKKVIRTQQSMLTPRIISSQKCLHCEKSFLNSSFLQNHMQRRHPDEYEMQLLSDSEKKSQIESLRLENSSLKEQIVQLQQALQAKRAQETNQNQAARYEKSASPVHSQPERDMDIYKEMQIQTIQKLEHQLKRQDKKWESRLQEIKAQHESEKNQLLNELSRMQSSVSEHQNRSKRLQQEMSRRLQENKQTIKAQREQIRNISSNPPTKVVEVPVMVSAPAPQPKSKRVGLDSRSISERKPEAVPEKKQRVTTSIQKGNANIKKGMRPELEQAVITKLENLGVKPDQTGLKNKELTSLLAKLQSKRDSSAKGMPDYWRHREEIASTVEQKLGGQRRGSDPAPESQARSRQSVQVLQIRPRSSSLPSRATQVMSASAVKQPKTPQPAPRTKTTAPPKTSIPNTKSIPRTFTTKTPPFSSDNESDEEMTDTEEEQPQDHPRAKSLQPTLNQTALVQNRIEARQAPTRQFLSNPQQSRGSVGAVTKTAVTEMESNDDEDWSDVSELQEVDPRQLHSYRDQNRNMGKTNSGKENKSSDLTRKMERQFAERVVKKPAGGVSILTERKDEVQELRYSDQEDSSDWVVSSLEEKQEVSKPAQVSGPLRKSLESSSTSVWGTSTGKGPKSGLTEAGTGSSLKSSLYSLSDVSDSEDISNKHHS